MKVYEKSFREVYRQVSLLSGKEILDKINLREVFDYQLDENLDGFICYGFVDAETGFHFKILAGAQLDGELVRIVPASYKKNFSIRRAEIEDAEIKILPEKFATAFRDKIQVINDAYAFDAAKENTRRILTLDALRHPNFPDDVAVTFHGENLQPEQAWVRCESADGRFISGRLLHELQQDFGVHTGDEIKFGVTSFNGRKICFVIW